MLSTLVIIQVSKVFVRPLIMTKSWNSKIELMKDRRMLQNQDSS